MPKKKYQTRLPADTAEDVDEYRDEHEISQAEAVRRLVSAGLKAEADGDGETHRAAQVGTVYVIIGLGLLAANLVATLALL